MTVRPKITLASPLLIHLNPLSLFSRSSSLSLLVSFPTITLPLLAPSLVLTALSLPLSFVISLIISHNLFYKPLSNKPVPLLTRSTVYCPYSPEPGSFTVDMPPPYYELPIPSPIQPTFPSFFPLHSTAISHSIPPRPSSLTPSPSTTRPHPTAVASPAASDCHPYTSHHHATTLTLSNPQI